MDTRPLNEIDMYFNWFSDICRHLESLVVKKKKEVILKPICFSRLHLVHQSEVVRYVTVRAKCGGAPTYRKHCSFNQDRLLHLEKLHRQDM